MGRSHSCDAAVELFVVVVIVGAVLHDDVDTDDDWDKNEVCLGRLVIVVINEVGVKGGFRPLTAPPP